MDPMRTFARNLSASIAILLAVACGGRYTPDEHVLFESAPTDTIPYRIPALAVMPDGGLVALADYRYCKKYS